MENIQDAGRYNAAGYSFYTKRDAELAVSEQHKVDYLEARIDYDNPESILRIYNKAVEERIFKAPPGLFFLKKLQLYLLNQPDIISDSVKDIPLQVSFEGEFREQSNPAHNRVKPAAKKPEQKKSIALPISVIMNIALVAAVIAMFVITLNADQPNILNYEKALLNRYAAWEQELVEREQAVRQHELELNIE